MSKRSDYRSILRWTGALAIALGAVMMLGPSAQANTLRRAAVGGSAQVGGQDTFFSAYFDFGPGSTVDNILRLENPTAVNGNMCAMIYVFDTREEMGECCGCLLTPNQIRHGGVKAVIGSKWIGSTPSAGVLQIISALPNNGTSCSPGLGYIPTPTVDGWITHVQTVSSVTGLTEVDLTDNGDADPVELTNLTFLCAVIVGNGSGNGVCTCPTSDVAGIP